MGESIYTFFAEKVHDDRKIHIGTQVFDIPEEYGKYIGVIPDRTLFRMSYSQANGNWEGPSALIDVDVVDRIVEASQGSKRAISHLVKRVLMHGIEGIMAMRVTELLQMRGVGKSYLNAYIRLGVTDDRVDKSVDHLRDKAGVEQTRLNGRFVGMIDGKYVKCNIEGLYTPTE